MQFTHLADFRQHIGNLPSGLRYWSYTSQVPSMPGKGMRVVLEL